MITNILKLGLFLMTFSLFHFTFGQTENFEIIEGEEVKKGRKEYVVTIKRGDNKVFTIKSQFGIFSSGDYTLEVYNEDMNLQSSNEVVLPGRDMKITRLEHLKGQLYVFIEEFNKNNKTNTIYIGILSENGTISGKLVEVTQFELEHKKKVNDFQTTLSADSTLFLVTVTPPVLDKEQEAKRQFITIDLELNVIEDFNVEFDYLEKDFEITQTHLDVEGNIHMLSYTVVEETKRGLFFKDVDREAKLLTLYDGANDVEEYDFPIQDSEASYISQIKLKTDKLGNIRCAGFYSDWKGNSTKGIFSFTINSKTKEISEVISKGFEESYLNQFLTDRQLKKKKRKEKKNKGNPYERLHNFKIRDLVMREDGGFYLIAEYYLHIVSTSTDANGVTRTTHDYYYNDLMVINILVNNKVDWCKKVSKHQHTINDGGSYSGVVYGLNQDNSLNIIFNDNVDNLKEITHNNLTNMRYKNLRTVLVNFNLNGEAEKTLLLNNKKSKGNLIPHLCLTSIENDIILYLNVRKSTKLINLILD